MSEEAPIVRERRESGVEVLRLNRPAQRNALSRELQRTLATVVADLDGADDVDVIVLTGADPAFCAGVDLKELGSSAGGDTAGLVLPKENRGPFPPRTTPLIGAIRSSDSKSATGERRC